MSSWKEYSLKDCIELVIDNRGKTPPLSPIKSNYELIEIVSIANDRKYPDFSKVVKYVDKDTYDNWFRKGHPKKGDILFSTVGSIGNIAILQENRGCIAQNLIALRSNKNLLDSNFLYYLLLNKETKSKVLSLDIGTVQPNIKVPHLLNMSISLPDISIQKGISKILSTLDEKIELNILINQTLEQIAQAIFKSWFIDFDPVKVKAEAKAQGSTDEQANIAAMSVISGKSADQLNAYKQTNPTDYQQLHQLAQAFPSEFEEIDGVEVPKGWGVETLSEVSSMRNGYAFKSNEWIEEGIPVIKIGSIKPMIVEVEGNGFVSEENKSSRPDFVVKEGDILVGLTGYVGEVGRIPQHKIAMLNQRVAKFIPNKIDNKYTFYNFIYCAVRNNKFKEYATINAKGSAQANISTNELLKYPIIKATDNIHISFEKYVENILDKILKNSGENEFLEKTRDLLLPKLLSGEIAL